MELMEAKESCFIEQRLGSMKSKVVSYKDLLGEVDNDQSVTLWDIIKKDVGCDLIAISQCSKQLSTASILGVESASDRADSRIKDIIDQAIDNIEIQVLVGFSENLDVDSNKANRLELMGRLIDSLLLELESNRQGIKDYNEAMAK